MIARYRFARSKASPWLCARFDHLFSDEGKDTPSGFDGVEHMEQLWRPCWRIPDWAGRNAAGKN